ncbi:MAG: histone deacetylase family protein [Inhella sp.]
MRTVFTPLHALHAPATEFFRGERVPCFEKVDRARYVHEALVARGHRVDAPEVDSRAVLPQVHGERYLAFLESAWARWLALAPATPERQPCPPTRPIRTLRADCEPAEFSAQVGVFCMDSGTPSCAGTWAAAQAGADAAATAARWVSQGERAAFVATRPPGHHAGPDFMGGYCFLNNAAVAAQALRNAGAARVAVLDVDYHHGNGTQAIFYERADVAFVSLHGDPRTEFPFFLGHADETGAGAGRGHNLNLPLPAGTDAQSWFQALAHGLAHIRQSHAQALVVSLGLDTFENDPISKFRLRSDDFLRLGERIAALGLPTVFVLEGGYAVDALGLNAVNVLEGFEAQAAV